MKRKSIWMRMLSGLLVHLMLLQGIPVVVWAGVDQDVLVTAFAGEPLSVDLRTGELTIAVEDLRLGIDQLPLALGRVYRSNIEQSTPGLFGHKWHSILDMRVERKDDAITLRDDNGRLREYVSRPGGIWVSTKHDYEVFRLREDGDWERHLKTGIVYRFDPDGRLVEITDPNGRFIRITRSDGVATEDGQNKKIIRVEDRYGRFITVTLNADGLAIEASDSLGRQCVYTYDEKANLKATINRVGGAVVMAYDEEHRLIELKGGGGKYALSYKNERIAAQSTQRGTVARYDYISDKKGNLVCRLTDASGAVSQLNFAQDGQITVTDPTGVEEMIWLNERELPVKAVGANGSVTEITYDHQFNPVTISVNDVVTRLTYAPDNTLVSVDADTGELQKLTYDERRNITMIEDRRGAQSRFEWDRQGLLRTAEGPTGQSVALTYDAQGQVRTINTSDGQQITLEFDPLGLLRELITPTGVTFRYAYDPFDRLTVVENSEGQSVRLVRNAQGQVVRTVDAAGNETRMEYDPSGLLTMARDPVGAVTRLDYDTLGRPITVTDAKANVTRWTYDPAGRILSEIDALGQPTTLTYNAKGQVEEQVNRRGQKTVFDYDRVGRAIGYEQAGALAAVAYDPFGRMVGMKNADSDFAFTLASDGLLERVTDRMTGIIVAYEYDAAGRRIKMTAGEEEVRYVYNQHRLLSSIDSSAGRVNFEYDPYGRRTTMRYPNGVQTTYQYDKLNRVTEIRATAQDGSDVSRFRYAYDVLGNRTQMIEGEDRIVNYEYDAISRLVSVVEDGLRTEYVYDEVGNRIGVLINGEREDYLTGKDNRLLKAGQASFAYDADGNMIRRTTSDGKRYEYTYDAANRMVKADGPDGTVSYGYAPNGARVSRSEGAKAPVRFVFDGEDVLFEVENGKPIVRYLHGPGIDEPLAQWRDDVATFYQADGLGSIAGLTDGKGYSVGRYTYDAFGQGQQVASTVENSYRYTGREWDSTSALYFYRARSLFPDIGRFVGKDPIGMVDGPNQYAYVRNNPVNLVDPLGFWGIDPNGPRIIATGEAVAGIGIMTIVTPATTVCALIGIPIAMAQTAVDQFGGQALKNGWINGWDNIKWAASGDNFLTYVAPQLSKDLTAYGVNLGTQAIADGLQLSSAYKLGYGEDTPIPIWTGDDLFPQGMMATFRGAKEEFIYLSTKAKLDNLQYYGLYGGPTHTGGREITYQSIAEWNTAKEQGFLPYPDNDPEDALYYAHDYQYVLAREKSNHGDIHAANAIRHEADQHLANGLRNLALENTSQVERLRQNATAAYFESLGGPRDALVNHAGPTPRSEPSSRPVTSPRAELNASDGDSVGSSRFSADPYQWPEPYKWPAPLSW